MNDFPLVSVLIISYNQIDFVEEALSGALEQDYDNLEVIVADDGSTDGTAEVIMEYAEKFPKRLVPIVGGPNLGITGNSNRGLRACTGKYVCWQGGDDVLLPSKVSSQVEWMEADERRAVCYHDVEAFNSSTNMKMYLFSERFKMREGTSATVVKHGTFMCACSVMFRRSCLPQYLCNPLIKVASDWLLVIETLEGGSGNLGHVEGVHARHRRHSGNVTNQDAHRLREQLLTLDIVEKKYPHLLRACRQNRSVAYFVESWKSLIETHFSRSIKYLFRSFLVCRGVWISPLSLLVRRLFKMSV